MTADTLLQALTTSIIMSTYREPSELVEKAVRSVIDQMQTGSLEFIMVLDDPDNEELHSWASSFQKTYDNFIILRNEHNLGLAKSLNRAIDVAQGRYICRMDADDIAFPKRLAIQQEYLEKYNLDLIGGRVTAIDSADTPLYDAPMPPSTPESIQCSLRWNNCLAHPTWFGKREVFMLKYRNIPLCEDYDFQLRAVSEGFKLGNCPNLVLGYRLSEGGISQSNLYRQYLYQRYITKCYRRGRIANIQEAEAYVVNRFTEKKACSYAKASKRFTCATSAASQARYLTVIRNLSSIPFISIAYLDKIRRLALTTLAGRLSAGVKD